MKIIFETSDYSELLVKKALLDQVGFLVHLDNFEAGSVMPHLGFALGYRLWVPDFEADDACVLLSEAPGGAVSPLADEDKVFCCPECGSDEVVRYRSMLWLPVLYILNILYPAPGGNLRSCIKCGHKYKAKDPALTKPLIALIAFVIMLTLLGWAAYYIAPEGENESNRYFYRK